MTQHQFAFFEKDKHGKLVNINKQYLTYLGIQDEKELCGKSEVDIAELKPFHKMYSIGEQEARLLKGVSVQKELFYFSDKGPESIITTRTYLNLDKVEIRGFFFKIAKTPVTWDGKNLTIWNYFKPVKLPLLKFYVLTLKCRGHNNLEIANRTFRAESTIRNIVQDLYCAFEVYDFVTLARYYDLGGWLNKLTMQLLSERF
ncbi:hypothetical protein [Caedibacter taeniospiralis]|jgi:hypothetical protein|uniref:hypothetical protein n=1 Tax=Caedibacter taeniospiralis TaxID=28907 RepID=UPI0037C15CE6